MIVFNYQLDQMRIRHRSEENHDAPQSLWFFFDLCTLYATIAY